MPQNFVTLVREHEETIVRAWVDGMYAERRTEIPATLSYEQLLDHLPDTLQELAWALDAIAKSVEQARVRAGALRRVLLDAAFSGRLTGWPTDLDMVEEMAGV